MILFLFSSLTFSLKIHQNSISHLLQRNSKSEFDGSINGICPTYSLSQNPITSSCTTKSMSYSKGYDPAYIVDSSKNLITLELQSCNFSLYKLTSLPIYSLIHITGSNSVNLNVIKCNFDENKFPHTSGIFYTSKGEHTIMISSSNFIRNEGQEATILSDTCYSLTMMNCYIGYNKCNGFKGQIYLKAQSNIYNMGINKNDEKSTNANHISLTSVTFLLNECTTRNSMLLEGYTSVSFFKCSFSCSGKPKNMIELSGKNIDASFNDCCFYGYFPYYPYDYYHIYFPYTVNSGNKAKFSGTNSFGGEKSVVSNLKISFNDGNFEFQIPECVHIDPTVTSTPKATSISDSPSPTESFSPSISPSESFSPSISPSESFSTSISPSESFSPSISPSESFSTSVSLSDTPTKTFITVEPTLTEYSSSDSGNDNSNESDKNLFAQPWFIVMVVVFVVAVIVAFVAGWFISKSCHRKDDRSMRLNTSDTFHSTLLSD